MIPDQILMKIYRSWLLFIGLGFQVKNLPKTIPVKHSVKSLGYQKYSSPKFYRKILITDTVMFDSERINLTKYNDLNKESIDKIMYWLEGGNINVVLKNTYNGGLPNLHFHLKEHKWIR